MFNSGFRGKRASDNAGIVGSQTQFIQQKSPEPSITDYSIQGTDDTALDPAGGQTVLVNGTGFASGAVVIVNGQTISPVTVNSPTQLSFTSIALAGGSYSLVVYNSTGGAAILVPGLIYSAVPTWTTAAGSIGTYYETIAINSNVVATSDSAITYSLASGSLPSGATLYANGVITGTSPVESGSSTYTFAIKAEDAELQDTTRTFTLTINTDVVSWVSPADGTTYTANINEVAGNVVLSATSAAGYNVSYAANTLPTGLTLTGDTISGTPTVAANSSTLLTATAATTNRNATRTINWVIQLGSDPYFYATTLLLNGETSSNYWIQDASTNNYQLTVFNDTRPNAFSPYNNVYSVLFDGSNNYLSVNANSAFSFGTGDFTIECFVRTGDNSLAPGGYSRSIMRVCQIDFYLRIAQYHGGTDGALIVDGLSSGSTVVIKDNIWHHIALVRQSSTVRLWIDGVYQTLGSGGTNTTNYSNSELNVFGGRSNPTGGYFNGYISNLRIVKGTAVYTGTDNFTVPTSPLTAINNTSILICSSNRYIDKSINNLTVTAVSNPTISNFAPLVESDLITGSGYFDGNGDYLTAPASFDTSNNWTVEAWCYFTGSANNDPLFVGNIERLYLVWLGSTFYLGDSSINNIVVNNKPINRWFHIAAVKNSTTYTVYIDGISVGTSTSALITATLTSWWIGARTSQSQYATGYISNFRAVNGTAVYTSNFTPPTSPLTAIANTTLLTLQNRIGENNNRFIDTSGINNIITRNGNTTQGTFSPFSQTGWSNYFDGTGDYLTVPANAAFDFGTGEYTIEGWINVSTTSWTLYATGGSGAQDQFVCDAGTLYWAYSAFSGGIVSYFTSSDLNKWTHVAVSRASGTLRAFKNGTIMASVSTSASIGSSVNTLQIGRRSDGIYLTNGYMSNIRVLKGTGLYTAAFTPPTSPLTAIANTSLLTCADNRFIDDSANNFTITRNGDVSVQSFSPFTPTIITPTSYSGYFDGTGDYLSISSPSSSIINWYSTDFTLEGWIYPTTLSGLSYADGAGTHPTFVGNRTTNDGSDFWGFGPCTDGQVRLYYYNGSSGNTVSSGLSITLNFWNHIAFTKTSSGIKFFVNGTASGFTALNGTPQSGSGLPFLIGVANNTFLTGYISNIRLVNGTAVYSGSTYTVPTSPLIAIANTSLLTCQSTTFIDNSTNNFTITVNGDTKSTQISPFSTRLTGSDAAYSITNVGGSVYFDGTGDYLNWTNSLTTFGTGNFTVEAWIYVTGAADFGVFGVGGASAGSYGLYWINSSRKFQSTRYGDAAGAGTTTNTYERNQWIHVAAVRSAGTARLYVNGVLDSGSTYAMGSITNSGAYTGAVWNGAQGNGYISGLRVYVSVVYASGFAPETTPATSAIGSIMLLTGTNSGIIDYTSKNILETVGNAQLSTSVKKFGSASMYFDGNGDYLTFNNSDLTKFGTGDFTVECWSYLISRVNAYPAIFSNYNSFTTGSLALFAGHGSANTAKYQVASSGTFPAIQSSTSISYNTWVHLALVRYNNTLTLYINGAADGTVSVTSTNYTGVGSLWYIGTTGDSIASGYINGYIDDLRITKGIARYTTNFTAPTQAFITF